jgi:hypothetical protein
VAVIEGGKIIEGAYGPRFVTGAPTAGTDEVQTITIGGTPTGGTFKLAFDGHTTANITWSATNTTLVANVDAALEALPNIGTGGVAVAVGTMTAGIGTLTVTFSGANLSKRAVPTMTVAANALTGTTPTVAVAETTPGVDATARGAPVGAVLIRDNGTLYSNTGTALNPTWTVIGSQS